MVFEKDADGVLNCETQGPESHRYLGKPLINSIQNIFRNRIQNYSGRQLQIAKSPHSFGCTRKFMTLSLILTHS